MAYRSSPCCSWSRPILSLGWIQLDQRRCGFLWVAKVTFAAQKTHTATLRASSCASRIRHLLWGGHSQKCLTELGALEERL